MVKIERTIEERVKVSMAISEYIKANNGLGEAAKRVDEARSKLSEIFFHNPTLTKFLLKIDFRYYLITSDGNGDFDIEEMEVL